MENMGNKNTPMGGNDAETEPKTFTQEELDRIIADRLAREKAKQPDLEAREKALTQKEKVFEAKELLREKKLPECFSEFLAGAEDMKAAAGLIEQGIAEYSKANLSKSKGGASYEPHGGGEPDHEQDIRRKFGLLD